ncbi:MAG: tetratricopeptide repeat protein, partial [Bacteroidales bacterium]|nr:tetratricopeptide repeat protein [Bacteroidales bacterium]
IPEDIFQILGTYCLKNNKIDMSIEIFQKYVSTYNTSFTAYNYLGEALFAKKQIKKAEENFKKAVELKPDYEEAKENLKRINE